MKLLSLVMLLVYLVVAQDDEDENPKKVRPQYNGPDKYQNLVDWLKDGKAEFPKVEIWVKNEGYRALRAKQNIQRGEWVIFVPRTHFLTLDEVKKACLINRKMIQVNFKPLSHQTYFVNHLLQEKRRKNSVWKPYIDVLPTDVSGFPTYFGEEELALLKGSPTLNTVMDQRQQFRQEYDNLQREIPEFVRYKYTYDDFLKLRILTNSRSFNVNLNNEMVPVLVPLADFINHDNDGFLTFDYSPQHDGFYMQATRDIRRGEELFYNYGKLSNKFFFMNYGFALDSISMNQYDFMMCLNQSDPLYELKVRLVNGMTCYSNRLVNETDHGTWREVIAHARYQAIQRLDEYFQMERKVQGYRNFNPGWHLWPVNTPLEKKMWTWLKGFLTEQLNKFASTIEEDYSNLRRPELPDFRKQIIIVTLKEKQIIKENIDLCDLALEIVEKSSTELQQLMRYGKYHKLQGYMRQELIPMKTEINE